MTANIIHEQEQLTFMPLRVHFSQLGVRVYALWLRVLTCRKELQSNHLATPVTNKHS
jgi:hypothetical protein